MTAVTIYDRLGGEVSIHTIVRTFYAYAQSDMVLAGQVDDAGLEAQCDRDEAVLARVLGSLDAAGAGLADGDTPPEAAGVLLSDSDPARRCLQDVLWLLGVSSGLVDEVLVAVRRVADAQRAAP